MNGKIYDNICQTVGNTPIVRLNRIPKSGWAEMLVKLEFFNPGGSVKDRVGLYMIQQAERAGRLRPGGTLVEATAGNTGMALAMAAATQQQPDYTDAPYRFCRTGRIPRDITGWQDSSIYRR